MDDFVLFFISIIIIILFIKKIFMNNDLIQISLKSGISIEDVRQKIFMELCSLN